MEAEPCRVVVVDDHELYRRGLVSALRETHDLSVVGQAADGQEAVETVLHLRPQVVLMDLEMPRLSGVEATRRILAQAPATRIVVVSALGDTATVVEALVAGVTGYVLKEADPDDVVAAVRAARDGESALSPRVARALVQRVREDAPRERGPRPELTDRELEVLGLMAAGAGNQAIAQQLFISDNTVKRHVSSILEKLEAANRVQAVVRAYRSGLLTD